MEFCRLSALMLVNLSLMSVYAEEVEQREPVISTEIVENSDYEKHFIENDSLRESSDNLSNTFLQAPTVPQTDMKREGDLKQGIEELKTSVSNMSAATTKVALELAKVETETVQTALKAVKNSLVSVMKNMYELVVPLARTQTIYKSADGNSYIIPTTSIAERQKFNISQFNAMNEEKIKSIVDSSSNSQPMEMSSTEADSAAEA